MSYALDNAMFQWSAGEARLREAEPQEQADLERAAAAVGDELRRRLGSSFELEELIALYASGTEWADEIASRNRAGLRHGRRGGRRVRALRPRGRGLRGRPDALRRGPPRTPRRALAGAAPSRSCGVGSLTVEPEPLEAASRVGYESVEAAVGSIDPDVSGSEAAGTP